jgi:hypothetical protein
MSSTPIGATANILFDDGVQVDGYYISFGTYRDDDEHEEGEIHDNFGVPDSSIFYYAPEGEAELIELMKDNPRNDFKILSYELEY